MLGANRLTDNIVIDFALPEQDLRELIQSRRSPAVMDTRVIQWHAIARILFNVAAQQTHLLMHSVTDELVWA